MWSGLVIACAVIAVSVASQAVELFLFVLLLRSLEPQVNCCIPTSAELIYPACTYDKCEESLTTSGETLLLLVLRSLPQQSSAQVVEGLDEAGQPCGNGKMEGHCCGFLLASIWLPVRGTQRAVTGGRKMLTQRITVRLNHYLSIGLISPSK